MSKDLNTIIEAVQTSDGASFTARWALAEYLATSEGTSEEQATRVQVAWELASKRTGIRSEPVKPAALRQYRAAFKLWGAVQDGTVSPWQAYAWRNLAKRDGVPLKGAALKRAWASIPATGRPEREQAKSDIVNVAVPRYVFDALTAAAEAAGLSPAELIEALITK